MGKIVSYTNFDYEPTSIIPVIASFDSQGHISPLWVRINGQAYKVESFWSTNYFRNIVDFKCKIIDGESIKPLALSFYREEGMWTISRH